MKRLAAVVAAAALALVAGKAVGEGDAGVEIGDDPAAVWLAHVRACLKGVLCAEAEFTQEVIHPLGPASEPMEGLVRVRRGGLLRLDYRKPTTAVLVSDGSVIRSFDPGSRAVFASPVGQSILPAAFGLLAGDGPPAGVRWLGGARRPGEGPAALEIPAASGDPVVARVVATVDAGCPCVRRVIVVDRAGSIVRITLGPVRVNTGLGRGLFAIPALPRATVVQP